MILVDSAQQEALESIRVMEPTGLEDYIHNSTGVLSRE
jgi:hypothetical protein